MKCEDLDTFKQVEESWLDRSRATLNEALIELAPINSELKKLAALLRNKRDNLM
jgi:hypothetical protein